jgi:hypothetical protein
MRGTKAKRARKLVIGDRADVRTYEEFPDGSRRLTTDTPRWMYRQLKSMYKRGAIKL